MIILPLDELKVIAKKRGIKDYENKSDNDLIKILSEPKTKIDFSKKRIKSIRKDFKIKTYVFRNENKTDQKKSL